MAEALIATYDAATMMGRFPPIAALGVALALIGAPDQPFAGGPHQLVAVKRANLAAAAPALRAAGAELVSHRLALWRLPPSASAPILAELRRRGWLRAHEPERTVPPAVTLPGDDPLALEQWWVPRVRAQGLQPPLRGVPITVIDSGLDFAHPEFSLRSDTLALNEQTLVGPRAFHGTAVSSVVAAPENGLGLVGLYPTTELRTWDASPGFDLTSTAVIQGIEAAAARGPGVINLSLGGSRSAFEAEAVNDAFARGSIVVAAAGNGRRGGSNNTFPATLPRVLTVGSTDRLNRVSRFSSRSSGMDLAAPGEDIWVAVPSSFDSSGFLPVSGTSFAAPIVAAATAWVWTARPKLDNTQIFELMRRSARDLRPKGRDEDTGFGLLDLRQALRQPAPSVDPAEPNDSPSGVRAPALVEPRLTARLDVTDDPRDFYRLPIPPGARLTATLASSAPIFMQLADPAGAVTMRRLDGGGRRWLLQNPGPVPVEALVKLYIRLDARPTHATYRLVLAEPAG
jgi:Subtilase family